MGVSRRTLLTGALSSAAGYMLADIPVLARWPDEVPEGLIFFVGNSFTRQHDVPGLVCRIARQAGVEAHCHRQTANGAKLISTIEVPGRLAQDWPGRIPARVVLQDHSTVPLTAKARAESTQAMIAWDRHFQGTTLFETWPRRAGHPLYSQSGMPTDPQQMAELTHAHYTKQASALHASLAPIAPAWIAATAEGLDLYAVDGYHANLSGAWLCALLLARALSVPDPFAAAPPPGVPTHTHDVLTGIAAAT